VKKKRFTQRVGMVGSNLNILLHFGELKVSKDVAQQACITGYPKEHRKRVQVQRGTTLREA
jgi:hypothetical protein